MLKFIHLQSGQTRHQQEEWGRAQVAQVETGTLQAFKQIPGSISNFVLLTDMYPAGGNRLELKDKHEY